MFSISLDIYFYPCKLKYSLLLRKKGLFSSTSLSKEHLLLIRKKKVVETINL